ncbi:flagellar biosynthesis protein FliO, partial [Rhizobium ruizarguesonis]
LLIIVLWVIRSRAHSPFVRGGRNRKHRLQVLDAAAVDARRRLVLVRRDDVEHLIMIGGPTGAAPRRAGRPCRSAWGCAWAEHRNGVPGSQPLRP